MEKRYSIFSLYSFSENHPIANCTTGYGPLCRILRKEVILF